MRRVRPRTLPGLPPQGTAGVLAHPQKPWHIGGSSEGHQAKLRVWSTQGPQRAGCPAVPPPCPTPGPERQDQLPAPLALFHGPVCLRFPHCLGFLILPPEGVLCKSPGVTLSR